jgi:hypothetical protein
MILRFAWLCYCVLLCLDLNCYGVDFVHYVNFNIYIIINYV